MTKPRVLIVGVGRLGNALAKSIAPTQQAEIALFDADKSKVPHAYPIEKLVRNADYIFLCTPASAVRQSLVVMHNYFLKGAIVVSFIKGLDPLKGDSMHELLTELLPSPITHAIVGGPMLSAEIEAGQHAAATIGTDSTTYEKLAVLFAPTLLHIEHHNDAQGVAMAGVLKNIYALGLGIATALGVQQNVTGWLVQQALSEMTQLLPLLGGKAETAFTLAGLGDLVATGTSPHSRNRTVGHDLVTKGTTDVPSEGLVSLPILLARLGGRAQDFSFLTVIQKVVIDRAGAKQAFKEYLK